MFTGINVDMKPAAGVDHRPGMTQRPHDLLQFAHLGIFQHRRVQFYLIGRIAGRFLPPAYALRCLDAAIIDKAPFLAVCVRDLPGVVKAGFMRLVRHCTKQRSHRTDGLLPGDAGHLDFAAKFLVTEVKGQGPHLRSVRHPPPPAAAR